MVKLFEVNSTSQTLVITWQPQKKIRLFPAQVQSTYDRTTSTIRDNYSYFAK